jgi:hypothetical protein
MSDLFHRDIPLDYAERLVFRTAADRSRDLLSS